MFGSFGWNRLLTQPGGDYEPGVFDMRSGASTAYSIKTFYKGYYTITTFAPLMHTKRMVAKRLQVYLCTLPAKHARLKKQIGHEPTYINHW